MARMTLRLRALAPVALVPALVLTGILLSGCSAPAAETPENPDGTTETTAPVDGSSDLGLPAQTIGSDTVCPYSSDEIGALWGVPIVDTDIDVVFETGGLGGILYGCDYNQTDDGTGLTIGITYYEYDTEEGALQHFADAYSGADFDGEGVGQEIDDLTGVGDQAGILYRAEQLGTPQNLSELLYVRNGSLVVEITITDIINGVKPEFRDRLVETYNLKF